MKHTPLNPPDGQDGSESLKTACDYWFCKRCGRRYPPERHLCLCVMGEQREGHLQKIEEGVERERRNEELAEQLEYLDEFEKESRKTVLTLREKIDKAYDNFRLGEG